MRIVMDTAEIIYERTRNLPEPLAREVPDFVNFITLNPIRLCRRQIKI